jgi:beta-N-acetylhexosaminidase
MDYMRPAMPTAVVRRTVSQCFLVGIPGPELDANTRKFLDEFPVGGFVLFKRNVVSASQLRRLVAALHATGPGVRPLVAIDHEGGRVHRLAKPFTKFPPMAAIAAADDPKLAEAVGRAMARELAAVGIDVDFAPVLDVFSNPRNRVIGDRAFGTTPAQVARLALPFARGLLAGGVVPCGKHFPGHGATVGDSHFVLPRVRESAATIRRRDLPPFVRAIAAGFPALMTAHVVYPAFDPRRPATMSPILATTLLRKRLGFRGVLFSDDLDMRAVSARMTPARRAVDALAAGCDALLACQSLDVARDAILGVEAAVLRDRLPGARVAEAATRLHALRGLVRRPRTPQALGWPAHARLAARLERILAATTADDATV